jgi:simple sugar transport system permease protein
MKRNVFNNFIKLDNQRVILILTLFFVIVFFSIFKFDMFVSTGNFSSICAAFPEYGLMALGIMLAMISGGIDLSTVGIANFTSILAVKIMKTTMDGAFLKSNSTLIIIGAMAVSILIGTLIGYLNGNLISRIGIPPILATLGSFQLLTGLSIAITGGKTLSGLPEVYSEIGNNLILGIIPLPLIIFVICVIFTWYILNKTKYGLSLYFVGSNNVAAKFSGLNVTKIINKTYLYSGFLSAIAGLIMISNYNSAKADFGSVYSLQCVLIAILGGVNPNGGEGKIGNVILSIIILKLLSSGLNMFPNFNSFFSQFVWGTMLILLMVLNSLRTKMKIKNRIPTQMLK